MPAIEEDTVPKAIKPYLFHGLDIDYGPHLDQALGVCPFCDKKGMYINQENGCWDCKKCGKGAKGSGEGNLAGFLKLFHAELNGEGMEAFAKERKFLGTETMQDWGVGYSHFNHKWYIPGHNADRSLCQLYRYTKFGEKMRLLATPTMSHQIHGMSMWDDKKSTVYILEGPWDGIAFSEALGKTKLTDSGYMITANYNKSLLKDANVIAFPGANVFNESWCKLFKGKHVILMYDNDHAKKNNQGKPVAPAGITGMKRAAAILTETMDAPLSVSYLCWGEDGYDVTLPDGFDVRDMLAKGSDAKGRVKQLSLLLEKIKPVPSEWLTPATKAKRSKSEGAILQPLECTDHKTLIASWKRAMKWTPGLEAGLNVMLSSVLSTNCVGDQLWVKIIGPPSCLDGDTIIYDPKERTCRTVRERCQDGEKFSVYSRTEEGELVINQALPPTVCGPAMMYEVMFSSGKVLRVTAGHEFWTGDGYVALHEVSQVLDLCGTFHLPTISVSDLLTREQGVQHSMETAQDSQEHCSCDSCLCGEQLQKGVNTCQDVSPSLNDVPQRSHLLHKGVRIFSSECIHHRESHDHLSSFHDPDQNEKSESESRFCCVVDTYEHDLDSFASSLQLHKGQHQTGKVRSFLESVLESNGHEEQSGSQREFYKRGPVLLEESQQSELGFFQTHTEQHIERFSLPTNLASLQDEIESHIPLSNEESQLGQPVIVYHTEQSFDQTCKDERDDVFENQTNQHGQPCFVSLHKRVNLGFQTLSEVDTIIKIEAIGFREYYDFHVPETNNYWAEGFFHHNCGKSTLCEALSINLDYILAKSTIRGFHSGFQSEDREQDHSLISQVNGKTLVTKDGDTLIQSPNLGQVLSEARDVYDRNSRTSYRNASSKTYVGINMTWILCGTNSLRSLDNSELGERFLDCVIMEGIDEELEEDILWRVANSADRNLLIESDGNPEHQQSPEMTEAMQLTGGYINYLRQNSIQILGEVVITDDVKRQCMELGKFVAYMRARPSSKQDETSEREFAARLVSQHVRLTRCLGAVLNKTVVDDQVMGLVRKVALDTARGKTLAIVEALAQFPKRGMESTAVAHAVSKTTQETRALLRFLTRIGALESVTGRSKGLSSGVRWRLSERFLPIYNSIYGIEGKDHVPF